MTLQDHIAALAPATPAGPPKREQPIAIYYSAETFRVWNADDAADMRNIYRVYGCLVGSLPAQPQQNVAFSLPVLLSGEEAHVLVSIGAAQLYNDSYTTDPVVEDQPLKKVRVEDPNAKAKPSSASSSSQQQPNAETSYLTIRIPTGSKGRANNHPKPITWDQVKFPRTADEELRIRVFRDLWDRGYYMTSGIKFGGDYLVYPGDPSRYHAHYVAFIQPYNRRMTPLQIVSFGRLATTVKKTFILCSHSPSGQPEYVSIEWTGMN